MAHELCHIYIDARINGVFVEIICHKTALDILEEIGAPLTEFGSKAVEDYITKVKSDALQAKRIDFDLISLQWIKQKLQELEQSNTLLDRDMNNIIALKLKEFVDPVDKLGLIKHVRNSVSPKPPDDTDDLSTIPITKLNFDLLLRNIEQNNIELSKALYDFR